MQIIWCFAFCFLAANALRDRAEVTRLSGVNGWNVPLPNGSFEWVDLKTEKSFIRGTQSAGKVNFLLYTNVNPEEAEELEPSYESIINSSFDPAYHNVFFIHGWYQNRTTSMNTDMKYAYIEKDYVNFWFVEWEDAYKFYSGATHAVPEVGAKVAEMYDHLVLEHGVSRSQITIIGHSLGAHVAGYCGKLVQSGPVERIYGLDPAEPLYLLSEPQHRFASTDADYVEQVTTNAYQLGFAKPIGKVAIYVNGGKRQPGCGPLDRVTGLCSHRRSVDLFIEHLNSPKFLLVECKNYKQALANNCGTVLSNVTLGGEDNDLLGSSVYQLHTNDKSPYATGRA